MFICQAVVAVNLAAVKLVGLLGGFITKGIPGARLVAAGDGEQGGKDHPHPAAQVIGVAEQCVAIQGGNFCALLALADFSSRMSIVAVKGEHVPCQVFVRINDQGSEGGFGHRFTRREAICRSILPIG